MYIVDEALIQQSVIHRFPEPDKWDLNYIQHFLATKDMGPLALIGDDATIWGSTLAPDSHSPDLVALKPRQKEDAFSKWVTENAIISLFRCGCARFKKPSKVHGVVGYEDSNIFKITFWITSVLASLIPIASIVVLYCVHSVEARLGIIAAFNLLLSACLVGFTNARRTDVFAVTAA